MIINSRRAWWCWMGLHDWVVVERRTELELLDRSSSCPMQGGRELVRRACLRCHKCRDEISDFLRKHNVSEEWREARLDEAKRILSRQEQAMMTEDRIAELRAKVRIYGRYSYFRVSIGECLDEIERLRAAHDASVTRWTILFAEQREEIERLRAELAATRKPGSHWLPDDGDEEE